MLTCITARDFTNSLSKVVRCGASEAAVSRHTQPEPDSLWNLEPVQFTEQWVGNFKYFSCSLYDRFLHSLNNFVAFL